MSVRRAWAVTMLAAVLAHGGQAQPQGVPLPPPIAAPRDVPYAGALTLEIDASDVERGIYRIRERIPVAGPGPLTLLYPEWHPGKHAPRGPINLMSGLTIRAGGAPVPWRRHPLNVYAFHLDVPAGASEIDLEFQFVSPTQSNQGRVVVTREMLNLQWEVALLYPAGHYSSRIRVVPSVKLPESWRFGLYHLARHGFFVDELLAYGLVNPLLRLASVCDRLERAAIDGTSSDVRAAPTLERVDATEGSR